MPGKRVALRHETFGIDVGLLYPSCACFLGIWKAGCKIALPSSYDN